MKGNGLMERYKDKSGYWKKNLEIELYGPAY